MLEYCDELTCFSLLPCHHQAVRVCVICAGSLQGTHPKATVCRAIECRRTSTALQRAKHRARPVERKIRSSPGFDFQNERMRFLAITTPGLELWCQEELTEKLGDSCRVFTPSNAHGRLFFDCELTPCCLQKMKELLSVDRLVAVVWVFSHVVHDGSSWKVREKFKDSEEEQKAIERREEEIKLGRDQILLDIENQLHQAGNWDTAWEVYARWNAVTANPCCPPAQVQFRATCERHGTHIFKSQELAAAVGGAVIRKWHWKVDLGHFDVEIFAHVVENELVCGITLFGVQHHQNQRFRAPLLPDFEPITALKPSTAYAMVRMARLQPGEAVCDPFAGIGTIPIEAAHSRSDTFCLGGDIALGSLHQAAVNSKTVRGRVELINWDVGALPLRDGCLDVVITDMPFGLRHGKHTMVAPLYRSLVRELERVLNPNVKSRAYLLTIVTNTFNAVLNQSQSLCVDSVVDCVIGGLKAKIFCLRRKF